MKLIDHANLYFGTEFSNMAAFVKDFKLGELSDEYENPEEAVTHLLMFLSSTSKFL